MLYSHYFDAAVFPEKDLLNVHTNLFVKRSGYHRNIHSQSKLLDVVFQHQPTNASKLQYRSCSNCNKNVLNAIAASKSERN